MSRTRLQELLFSVYQVLADTHRNWQPWACSLRVSSLTCVKRLRSHQLLFLVSRVKKVSDLSNTMQDIFNWFWRLVLRWNTITTKEKHPNYIYCNRFIWLFNTYFKLLFLTYRHRCLRKGFSSGRGVMHPEGAVIKIWQPPLQAVLWGRLGFWGRIR